ncbi:MAG: hypothetical protein U9O56_09675 [Campylobacterota bacterium]|nr:hypothetical protein [Campylobacterota bacterium]
MIIIGDKYIPYNLIEKVTDIESINFTKTNSTISFKFDKEIMSYSMNNNINYIVKITSIKEAIYANSMNASYLICKKNLAKTIQNIAENYLFDTKVLVQIKDEDEIEELALLGIDGVIYL